MGKRLDFNRLGLWMDSIMEKIDAEHGGTNADLMWALGRAMGFPRFLAPDNDDQPYPDGANRDP